MTSKAKKQPSRNSVKKKAPEPVTETVIEGEAVVMPDEPAPDQPRKDTSFSDRGNKANSGEDTARPGSAPETATPSRPPALVLAALVIGLIAAGVAGYTALENRRLASSLVDSEMARLALQQRLSQSEAAIATLSSVNTADDLTALEQRLSTRLQSLEEGLASLTTALDQIKAHAPGSGDIDPALIARLDQLEADLAETSARIAEAETRPAPDPVTGTTEPDTTPAPAPRDSGSDGGSWWSFLGNALQITRIDEE